MKAYRSIEEINGPVDVASIVIPAKFVYEAVKSCARKKVKYLMIISSGFSEMGNNEEERRIVSYANDASDAGPGTQHLRDLFGGGFLKRHLRQLADQSREGWPSLPRAGPWGLP